MDHSFESGQANEIEADGDGTIASILGDNAQPVQFGQVLFKIKVG